MHPSNLGKLNGAIDSSPNAKAAHMANGQNAKGSGPVSLSAAIAVADYDLAAASEDFAMAVETAALADAFDALDGLKEQDITDAQNLVSEIDVDGNGISEEERKAALAAICNGP